METALNTLFKRLLLVLFCLTIGLTGARAESSAEIQDKLRALLSSLQSATGNFLAAEEALSNLDTKSAVSLLENATLQEPDNPMLVLRTFHAQAAHGDIEAAAKTARHLLELAPNDEMARLLVGTVALKQRQYNEAIRMLEGLDHRTVVGITSGIVLAWSHIGDGDYAAAEAVLADLADNGLNGFLIFHSALMADVADKREVALDYAKQAYDAEPYDVRFIGAYARMLANASRFDEALAIVHKFRDQGLTDPSVLALQADLEAGRRPGKLAPSAQAGAGEMFNSVGSALVQDGTGDLAAIYLRLALYLVPDFDLAAMEMGGLYDFHEQHQMANAIYQALPADSPYKPEAEVRIIRNIANAGDTDKAIAMLHDAVVADPDDLNAVVAWADMLRSDEQWTRAAEAYTLALGLVGGDHPQDWRFFYLRGMCYERSKVWDSAEKDFERALELNPGNPQVLNYLGYSWIDQGVHLEKALNMIRQALEWDPSDGYVVDSLGWAYYRLGRFEEAVQTLEQAVQLRASDPAINDHLGDAYWQIGRKLEARFQWSIASDLEPESDIGKAARAKLENGLEASEDVASNG